MPHPVAPQPLDAPAAERREAAGAARLAADLLLIHPPAVHDFRHRDDVLFAFLSDSYSVNVTSMYEMYPLGFFSIQGHLRARGLRVEIVNLASLMLLHRGLDVDKLLGHLEAPVFGLDVHWMPHCHGAIEIAGRIKAVHPDAVVIIGGISATYFAEQIVAYPAIDAVVRGYDTLVPVAALVEEVKRGGRDFSGIPNVVSKRGARMVSAPFSHKPLHAYNDAATDWSFYRADGGATSARQIMTLPNTGCAHDCNWCGGSRFAYRNMMGVQRTLITKDHRRVVDELRTLGALASSTSIYALQCYSETRARLYEYLDVVEELHIPSVAFEQFTLTDDETLRRMGRATRSYIMLSPESHDPLVSKLSGRGTFTMDEMEAWIPRALDAGIEGIMVWFFIGMREQTAASVFETVAYCDRLLGRFPGKNVVPLLCPMVPFLDPGSRFFEQPEAHGYRVFHRTFEEHRQAMIAPIWHLRLNYETEWLSRRQIQDVSYEAVARLVRVKGERGALPAMFCRQILARIDETRALLLELEHAVDRDGGVPASLRPTILAYNREILSYTSNQLVPARRPLSGKWYDDHAVPAAIIDACIAG